MPFEFLVHGSNRTTLVCASDRKATARLQVGTSEPQPPHCQIPSEQELRGALSSKRSVSLQNKGCVFVWLRKIKTSTMVISLQGVLDNSPGVRLKASGLCCDNWLRRVVVQIQK
jgi:hypothetical protein